MVEWGLAEPFDIDNGELDNVPKGECFCLGFEFAIFRQMIRADRPFTTLCLANNAVRIAAMAERHGRFAEWSPSGTEGWARITVGGKRADAEPET